MYKYYHNIITRERFLWRWRKLTWKRYCNVYMMMSTKSIKLHHHGKRDIIIGKNQKKMKEFFHFINRKIFLICNIILNSNYWADFFFTRGRPSNSKVLKLFTFLLRITRFRRTRHHRRFRQRDGSKSKSLSNIIL